MSMNIIFRDDVFQGEEKHPQCPFFEQFPSSADPYEDHFGLLCCHMASEPKDRGEFAETCKGDYLLCPIAYGKAIVKLEVQS